MEAKYHIPFAVAGIVLCAGALGADSASASLVGEVEATAASVVAPVTAPITQSLPQAAPPSTPAAAPAAPQIPVKLPAEVKPPPTPAATNDTAASPVEIAPKPVTYSVGGDGGRPHQSGDGAGESAPAGDPAGGGTRAVGTAQRKHATSAAPASVRPAKAAPRHRWLARVWPAIELGRVNPVLAALLAVLVKGEGAGALTASDAAAHPHVLGISRASGGDAALAEPSTHADAPDYVSVPKGGEFFTLLIILYFATMLALLVSPMWGRLRRARHH